MAFFQQNHFFGKKIKTWLKNQDFRVLNSEFLQLFKTWVILQPNFVAYEFEIPLSSSLRTGNSQ
jgi:hypothetical protein